MFKDEFKQRGQKKGSKKNENERKKDDIKLKPKVTLPTFVVFLVEMGDFLDETP